jgi:hypothetical protein
MARMLSPSSLVPSRSLGRLVGLERLAFKLESGQPAGSWIDRGAVRIVAEAAISRGLLAVGTGPLGPTLALHAARTGLSLHLLVPAGDAQTSDLAWAAALGARIWRVACTNGALGDALPELADANGWRYVGVDDARLRAGVRSARDEIRQQEGGQLPELVAVSGLLGSEGDWLATLAGEPSSSTILQGTFVRSGSATAAVSDRERLVLTTATLREVDAARRLLAREEGLIASRRGVAGLVALFQSRRDRRFSRLKSAVVLLANEFGGWADGPPTAIDETLIGEPLTLDALRADLRGALLRPPG